MKQLKGIKHIHFIGLCGYLMSGMAVMLKKMGYEITGSDQEAYSPTTDIVDKAGIEWSTRYSPSNLNNPDLVVIGGHIRSDNPEAQAAIKEGLTIISLPELIDKIFADKKKIVVAGTHGKTTTTSLIAWCLETAGLEPSYLVGGIIRNTEKGFKLGKGEFFVVEGDEYRTTFLDQRPKFFHYKPEVAVLTTCELDHPDYYKNLQEIRRIFLRFLNLVPENGLVVLGKDDSHVFDLSKNVVRPKVSYGLSEGVDYKGFEVELGAPARFKVKKDGQFLGQFTTLLPGTINVQNALGAIATADYLGVNPGEIQKGIATFKGVKRRFEIIGHPKGVTIIDDYAHHPTKIRETLSAARTRYQKNKIYCVFEPHTYSRTKALLSDYAKAFGQADEVILAALMPAREKGQKPSISSKEVAKAIERYNPKVRLIPESLAILEYLVSKVEKGDVVIIMSVGGLDNLAAKLNQALEDKIN